MVIPYEGLYSETFIRDQIAHLPFRVLPVYGTRGSSRFAGRQICPPAVNFLAQRALLRIPATATEWAERRIDRILAAFWKQHGVDVILAQFADTAPSLLESANLARIPIVVHCHGYDVFQQSILDRMREQYALVFRTAKAFIVGSSDMREQVLKLGAPHALVHFIPVGVDTRLFAATDPAANPPVVVAVGRFVEKKAPWATILAFHQALETCPDAKLIMAGDGPLLNACIQMTQALGIEEAIQFVGVKPPDEVHKLMAGARLFAQHSVRARSGDSEGTALTILEAAASGLPVVATRHSGIKDTMMDGVTGYLVEELDISGMGQRMAALLDNPALARELGANARVRVAGRYSIDRSIKELADVLRTAAARAPEK